VFVGEVQGSDGIGEPISKYPHVSIIQNNKRHENPIIRYSLFRSLDLKPVKRKAIPQASKCSSIKNVNVDVNKRTKKSINEDSTACPSLQVTNK
jgi:hypothetical protein